MTLCPRKLWHPAPNELESYDTCNSWHTIASSGLGKTTCTYEECMLTIYWLWPDVRLTQPIRQWRCTRRRRFFFMLLNLRLCHRIYNISLMSMNHDHTEKPVIACTCILNYTKMPIILFISHHGSKTLDKISWYTAAWTVICEMLIIQEILWKANHHHHTTTVLRPFFRDHPGELVPEENFWTLWCKGRLTEADTPTIRWALLYPD